MQSKKVWIDDEHMQCSICNNKRHISQMLFTKNSKRPNGFYLSYCKSCRTEKDRERRERNGTTWSVRTRWIERRAKENGVLCEITPGYLERLYNHQGGQCVYTEEPLTLIGKVTKANTVSVDQINPGAGYVPGNVVLVSTRANTIKSNQTLEEFELWMPIWFDRLQALLARGPLDTL